MFTPSAGTHHCVLGVMLDIFLRVDDPIKHHNQFRVTQCSDLDGLQQWCRSAVSAAAAMATAPAAEAADPPLTPAAVWDCQSGSPECAGSTVPDACMHRSNVDPGFSGNPASVDVPQHEVEFAEFASEMLNILRENDDPSESLSHEGASVTVQSAPSQSAPSNSAPSNSAPTAKRARSDSSGSDSSSQPTASLTCHNNLLRCFQQIVTQSLDTQVHCSTVSTENLTQRLQSLELNVSGVHVKLQAHDDKLDRLHGQVCMPALDSQAQSVLERAPFSTSLHQLQCCLPEPAVLCFQKEIQASFLMHRQHLTIAELTLRNSIQAYCSCALLLQCSAVLGADRRSYRGLGTCASGACYKARLI